MFSICFVCLGNICRSPMAEAVMRHEIEKRHWQKDIKIGSRATSHYNIGLPPHKGTQMILNDHDISWQGIKAEQLTAKDLDRFDLFIGMDQKNINDMKRILGEQAPITLFRAFSPNPGEIADPYYTGDFDLTFREVSESVEGLCAYIASSEDKDMFKMT